MTTKGKRRSIRYFKAIPRSVKTWLLLLGFLTGTMLSGLWFLVMVLIFKSDTGLWLWIGQMFLSMGIWYLIGWRYGATIEKWLPSLYAFVSRREKKQ